MNRSSERTRQGRRRSALSRLLFGMMLSGCASVPDGTGTGPDGALSPTDIVTSSTGFQSLSIAIDHVQGKGPDAEALGQLTEELDGLRGAGALDKQSITSAVVDGALAPLDDPDTVRTFDELDAMARGLAATHEAADGEAVLHMLYVDGRYEGDGEGGAVLGFAWGGEHIVMLADNIERACASGGLIALLPAARERVCDSMEGSVLIHEVGHLLGLVNNGLPMVTPHQDEPNGAHDTNEECVMYWAAERAGIAEVFADRFQNGQEGSLAFDEACLSDLRAAVDGG